MNKSGHTYEDVKEIYSTYIHNPDDISLIDKAYKYAQKMHANQFRKSGDPYIVHLIEVSYILASLHCGPSTIAAGLLHDTIEDCDVTEEELKLDFGNDIAEMVFCLTKIKALSHKRRYDKDFVAEGHRKIFLGMAKDIRVILIKLADRLHNMRTLEFQTEEKKIRISKETMDVYCPIAERLGLNAIKGELQDLCLMYLDPVKYQEIITYLNTNLSNREIAIKKVEKKIADLMLKADIQFELSARVKHPYSIYKKIMDKHYSFDQIYDIMALRVITKTVVNCYEILGIIHTEFKPLPGRFKDYIAVPKPNMYQSLHTTIIDNDGTIFEVQIRTKEMDEIDEGGVAAHWRYKEGAKYDPKKEQKEVMEKLHWFSEFVSFSNNKETDAQEYMNTLVRDIFEANIYCFTPHGKVIDLPTGSTPLDFAYKVHSKVGDSAVGALVNNVLVPLSTELKTGDVVEIKTSKTSNGPNEGWLKIVKTNQAKSHIKKILTKKNADYLRDTNIQKGRETLAESFKECDISEQKMLTYLSNELLENFNVENMDELFIAIANKNIQPSSIIEYLNLRKESFIEAYVKKNTNRKASISQQVILVKGTSNVLCTLATCCTPIPGDEIFGYISKGRGIKVHRVDCPNVANLQHRRIEVEWNPAVTMSQCPVELSIKATDRGNFVIDVLNLLAQLKVSCIKVNAKQHLDSLTATVNVTILVQDANKLRQIINSLVNIEGVYNIERFTH